MKNWIEVTREQLYELVWERPMSQLACEYSISDVGLSKLCKRHKIPTPPRGYWAKLEAGCAPPKPKLPSFKTDEYIRLPVKSAESIEQEATSKLSTTIANEKKPENAISVSSRLRSPCQLVADARDALQVAKVDDSGLLEKPSGVISLRVSPAQLPRALRVTDALFKAFSARGWETTIEKNATIVSVGDVPILISVEESVVKEEIPQKPDFKHSYSFHYNRQETVSKPSGRLLITIMETPHLWNYKQQRNWNESDKRAIEDRLNDVVIGMLKLVNAVHVDIAQKEREEREREEQRRQMRTAYDEQQRLLSVVAEEQSRVKILHQQARLWRESQILRDFIDHVQKTGRFLEMGLEGESLDQWVVWASEQADRMDPFTPSPPSILDDANEIEHMCDHLRGRR